MLCRPELVLCQASCQEGSLWQPSILKMLADRLHQGHLNVNRRKDACCRDNFFFKFILNKSLRWWQGSQRTLKATATGATNSASCFCHLPPGASTVILQCVPARLLQDAGAISAFCASIFIRLGDNAHAGTWRVNAQLRCRCALLHNMFPLKQGHSASKDRSCNSVQIPPD